MLFSSLFVASFLLIANETNMLSMTVDPKWEMPLIYIFLCYLLLCHFIHSCHTFLTWFACLCFHFLALYLFFPARLSYRILKTTDLWINICMIDSDLFPELLPGGLGVFRGVFLWNELAVLAHLVPPPPPPSSHSHGPILTYSWSLPRCSSAVTSVLTSPFLSRPLPSPTGLAPS